MGAAAAEEQDASGLAPAAPPSKFTEKYIGSERLLRDLVKSV